MRWMTGVSIFVIAFVLGGVSASVYLAVSDTRANNFLAKQLYYCKIEKYEAIKLASDVSSQVEEFYRMRILMEEDPQLLIKLMNKRRKPAGLVMGVGGG